MSKLDVFEFKVDVAFNSACLDVSYLFLDYKCWSNDGYMSNGLSGIKVRDILAN